MIRLDGVDALAHDPQWLPHAFDSSGSNLRFVRIPRELHRSQPFVDHERLRDSSDWATASNAALLERIATLSPSPIHFVFHTAFCCSTLVIDALDATDTVVGMKEPAILLSLMRLLERCELREGDGRIDLVLRLLARRFEGTVATIVKPSCFATPLIPHLLRALPNSRAVLLHSDIRTFLYSVVKRGIRGRSWGRQVFASCMKHFPFHFGYDAAETWEQTDLQIAGLGWLMRRRHLNRMATQWGPSRTLRLDALAVVQSPASTIERVSRFFELSVDSATARSIAAGPTFRRHSKERRPFGIGERDSERQKLRLAHEEEIEIIVGWIETLARQQGIAIAPEPTEIRLAG